MASKKSYQTSDSANASGVGTKKLSEDSPTVALCAKIEDGGASGKGSKLLPKKEGAK